MALPKYIGICGNPGSGKSTVQKIMADKYGITPVDDGWPLRDISMKYLGMTLNQVTTQEGKKEFLDILDKNWQVREILGELGNRFEGMFGEHIIPLMVTNSLAGDGPFSFGSVRKTQGWFYKKLGGVILEVHRPGIEPSPYAFDQYDQEAADFTIWNDGTEKELAARVKAVIELLSRRGEAA